MVLWFFYSASWLMSLKIWAGTSEREDSVSNGHGCMVHPPWTTLKEEKINIYIKNLASPRDT